MSEEVNEAAAQLTVAMANRLGPVHVPIGHAMIKHAAWLAGKAAEGDYAAALEIVRVCGSPPWDLTQQPPPKWWWTPCGRLAVRAGLDLPGEVSVADAAVILGVSRNTIYRYTKDNRLELQRPGVVRLTAVLRVAREEALRVG